MTHIFELVLVLISDIFVVNITNSDLVRLGIFDLLCHHHYQIIFMKTLKNLFIFVKICNSPHFFKGIELHDILAIFIYPEQTTSVVVRFTV